MYQIVASQSKYTEEEVREKLASAFPDWSIEAVDNRNNSWLARLHKDAEFPFDKEKDDSEDSSDDSDKPESLDDVDDSDDEDSDDDSEKKDKDSDEDGDVDLDDAKKDLVKELNDVIQMAQQTLEDLGSKAQEVADDASAKDDKIKEIRDTVTDLSPADELGGDLGLEGDPLAGPGAGALPGGGPGSGVPKPPRRPGVPTGAPKRQPGGVRPPGGPSVFTKRKTEVLTHPGVDKSGAKVSLLKAASELESSEQFKGYEIVSMTENADGSYSAKLKLVS